MKFDEVVYINLDRRQDRNQNVIEQSKKFPNVVFNRISAVDGKNIDFNSKDIKKLISSKGISDATNPRQGLFYYLTPGAVGCALSHRKVWELCANENKTILCFEDDIWIQDDIFERIEQINAVENYDMIFIGYHDSCIEHHIPGEYNGLIKTKHVFGLFAYIISPEGGKKLLDMFPIDRQIDSVMTNDKYNFYLVKPEDRLVKSEDSREAKTFGTDIQVREKFKPSIGLIVYFVFLFIVFLMVCIFMYK